MKCGFGAASFGSLYYSWTVNGDFSHSSSLCPHTGKSRNPRVENVPQCKLTIPSVHHEEGTRAALEASV